MRILIGNGIEVGDWILGFPKKGWPENVVQVYQEFEVNLTLEKVGTLRHQN